MEQVENPVNVPVTIDLLKPITINNVVHRSLSMRRPTIVNQIAMRKQSVQNKWTAEEEDLFMYASLCGCTPQDLMQLDMADYMELCRVYVNFLQRPQNNSQSLQNSLLSATDGSQPSSTQ